MSSMNKILILSLVITACLLSQCRNSGSGSAEGTSPGDTGVAKIVFREYEHSFGNVTEGEKVGYVFKFDNTGTGNLVIASATTTCGCTVPEYEARPVPPGGSGNMEVVFDTSGRNGMQTKTITVKSNAKPAVVLLKITAEVVPSNQ
jgi:hypothetical protein